MGMLTTGMTGQTDVGAATGTDATKSMFHDYLTNPNSTYAQDPSLSPQLKSATAPGVSPGSLSGSPDTVAKQGMTSDAYSKVYGGGDEDKPDVLAQAAGDPRFSMTNWNGQQVMTSQTIKDQIAAGAKLAGMDPMAYDKMLNPKTYGARWGVPDPNPSASGTGGAGGAGGAGGVGGTGGATGGGSAGSGGIIVPAANVTPVTTATYDPTQINVTPGMLASGNLAAIMDPNSPLMVQAATQGNQQANRRGLQNSSIGISAAQDSMLRAATPLAQQDASTQANIASANAGAMNSAGQFNAGAKNTSALTAQQLASQQQISRENAASQRQIAQENAASQQQIAQGQTASQQTIAKMNNDTQMAVSRMSSDTQVKMADIQQQNQKLLQSNSQAATAMNNYAATVANIQASKDMGAQAKQQAVDTQLTNLRNTLAALESQSGQNLEQFFPMLESTSVPETEIPNLADIRGY